MIQFLKDRTLLNERVNQNIDVHPSDHELATFHKIATTISPNQDFSYRGCQDCVNRMVKFCFANEKRVTEKNGVYSLTKKAQKEQTA